MRRISGASSASDNMLLRRTQIFRKKRKKTRFRWQPCATTSFMFSLRGRFFEKLCLYFTWFFSSPPFFPHTQQGALSEYRQDKKISQLQAIFQSILLFVRRQRWAPKVTSNRCPNCWRRSVFAPNSVRRLRLFEVPDKTSDFFVTNVHWNWSGMRFLEFRNADQSIDWIFKRRCNRPAQSISN